MDICELIMKKINGESSLIEYKEDFESVKINIAFKNVPSLIFCDIQTIVNNIDNRERVRLYIYDEGKNLITNYSSNDDLQEFINNANNELSNNSNINFKMTIVKDSSNNIISIYSLDNFVEYMEGLDLNMILPKFSRMLKVDRILFILKNNEETFNSESIFFSHYIPEMSYDSEKRYEKLDSIRSVCNFIQTSEYELLADDFNFVNCYHERLNKVMNKIKVFLSITSICDMCSVKNNNELYGIINGYKKKEISISYKEDINKTMEQSYDIQKWIYGEGNIIDKIGITRNILSISIKNRKFITDDDIFSSIKSAHSIYLKENVKEYLEAKAKVNEFIFDLAQKVSDISKEIGKSLKSNLIAIGTFYVTVVLMNILNDKRLDNIFTKDITTISLGIWIISLVYMFISKYEIKKDVRRFEQQYYRVRGSYEDILNKEDLDNIFREDKYLEEDKEYIKKKTRVYLIAWAICLSIMIIIICYLGFEHIDGIFESIKASLYALFKKIKYKF